MRGAAIVRLRRHPSGYLSFAAVAALSPSERVVALSMTSTTERIAHAFLSLRLQERRLAALLALRAADPSREPDDGEGTE